MLTYREDPEKDVFCGMQPTGWFSCIGKVEYGLYQINRTVFLKFCDTKQDKLICITSSRESHHFIGLEQELNISLLKITF